MKLIDGRTNLEIISRDECFKLLARGEVGRLGVVDGWRPRIFPVNYVLDGEYIVFRTDEGTKLEAGERNPVCFEIDHIDTEARAGWSVVVDGVLEEVTTLSAPEVVESVHATHVLPWARGPKEHWMRIVPQRITGRRIESR